MQPVQPQCLPDRPDLLDEERDFPEGWVVRAVRLAAAELVVEDDRAARGGECLDGFEVVMGRARSAVQHQHGKLARLDRPPDALEPVSKAPKRQPAFADGEIIFGCGHGPEILPDSICVLLLGLLCH